MERRRWIFIEYLRVIAMFMVMWPHLVLYFYPQWKLSIFLEWLINRPLHIIQGFGALGVCYFLLISGFLMLGDTTPPIKFILKKIKTVYLSVLILMFVAFSFIFILENFYGLNTYWHNFNMMDWVYTATVSAFISGKGSTVVGVLWYIVPCFTGWIIFTLWKFFGKSPLSFPIFFDILCLIAVFIPDNYWSGILGIRNLGSYATIMIFGYLIACLFRQDIPKKFVAILIVVTYVITVISFYRVNSGYYEAEPYILSIFIASITFSICALLNDYFKSNKTIKFLGWISFPFYVLHNIVGACVMSLVYAHVPYIVCLSLGIIVTILLSALCQKFILDPIAKNKLLKFNLKKR